MSGKRVNQQKIHSLSHDITHTWFDELASFECCLSSNLFKSFILLSKIIIRYTISCRLARKEWWNRFKILQIQSIPTVGRELNWKLRICEIYFSRNMFFSSSVHILVILAALYRAIGSCIRPFVLWKDNLSSGQPTTMAGIKAWVRRVRAGACDERVNSNDEAT